MKQIEDFFYVFYSPIFVWFPPDKYIVARVQLQVFFCTYIDMSGLYIGLTHNKCFLNR